jgi:hypothetical protein
MNPITVATLFALRPVGKQKKISVLYANTGGCYFNVPGIDPWDEAKDPRLYNGPHPVIAHPPCKRWGKFWAGQPLTIKLTGIRKIKGDDGGRFAAALASVRRWGGILEHPEGSHAWPHFGLHKPPRGGGWVAADSDGGWTCCVEQGRYAHYARKPTWLYAVGCDLPELDWGKSETRLDPTVIARIGLKKATRRGGVAAKGGGTDSEPRTGTPLVFRDLLISIARTVYNSKRNQMMSAPKAIFAAAALLAVLPAAARATSTTDYMNMQGVNVHWTYDGTSYGTLNLPSLMAYVGFKHMRAENAINASDAQFARLKGITDSGVKISMTYFWQDPDMNANIAAAEKSVSVLGAGAVEAIEGQNECDGNPASYTYDGASGFQGCIAFQKDLYARVKADPALASVPSVYNFSQTLGSQYQNSTPSMAGYADVGNMHVYFSTLPAIVALPGQVADYAPIVPNKPMIVTESGYPSCGESGYPYWVTPAAMAAYGLSASLDAFVMNVNGYPLRLTKYELADENNDPSCTDHENHFGMFNFDGSPKPIATAWHNFATFTADPSPTSAQQSVPNYTSTGGALNIGLTKSNGADLIFWTDATVMDQNHNDITAPTITEVVNLGKSYPTVKVYDPAAGTTLATYTNVSTVTFPIQGSPIIVDVAAAVTTPPVVVTTPPVTTPPVVVTTPTSHTFTAWLYEDAWQGNVTVNLLVDGKVITSKASVTAKRTSGTAQRFDVPAVLASGVHTFGVQFTNDLCGGTGQGAAACTSTTDRNLYIAATLLDGAPIGGQVTMLSNGTTTVNGTVP